jgi:plastocyanin
MKSSVLVLLGGVVVAVLFFAIGATILKPTAAQKGTDNSIRNSHGMAMSNNNSNNNDMKDGQSPSYIYRIENKYHNYKDGTFVVRAGGGGPVAPLTWFFPRHAEIKVGETVTWINPTNVGEPHTVTFMMDNNTHADFAAPFIISNNNTTISSAVPNANLEPIVMPGPNETKIIVAANNRSISPTVIDANGNTTHLSPLAPLTSANNNNNTSYSYTMNGTEKYVNSGWIWPQGQVPPGFAPINSFSVKFIKAGTYGYMCEIHPWMNGEVVVN